MTKLKHFLILAVIGEIHPTLLLDGHDSRINYEHVFMNKLDLYSYKFKGTGVRTQFCSDINGFILYVSSSKYCKNNVDGDMFLKMKLEKKITPYDCIAFDGGYYYYREQFIKNCAKLGVDFTLGNFLCPFRKEIGLELTDEENGFNKEFGSFRSSIESIFSDFGNKFKMFNNNTKITKVTNVLDYNIKYRLCSLLYNIQKFSDKYEIIPTETHKQWYNDNFDIKYTDEITDNTVQMTNSEKLSDIVNNHNYIIDLQDKLLDINLLSISDDDMDEIVAYEVEKILSHKVEDDMKMYFVKWKNYNNSHNSWVYEEDFNSNEILEEYWNSMEEEIEK